MAVQVYTTPTRQLLFPLVITGLYNSYQAEIPGRDFVVMEKIPVLALGVFEEKLTAFLGLTQGISMFIAWRKLVKEETVHPLMGVG